MDNKCNLCRYEFNNGYESSCPLCGEEQKDYCNCDSKNETKARS